MTCEEFLARHSDLLDDELPEAIAIRVRLHMAACERCARYDRVLRQGLALFRESEQIQPTVDPYLALQEHVARSEQPLAARRGPAVATLAAAAMLGFFAWSALDRMDDTRLPAVPADRTVQGISAESLGFWVNPAQVAHRGALAVLPPIDGGDERRRPRARRAPRDAEARAAVQHRTYSNFSMRSPKRPRGRTSSTTAIRRYIDASPHDGLK